MKKLTVDRRIVVTGASGQIGFELVHALQALGSVIALDRHALDLTQSNRVRAEIRSLNPHIIVNTAAYTAVDEAEREPALAMQLNYTAPRILAEEAARLGAALIHYSTDYVFDGSKPGPYSEDDEANPLNVYGRSKLAGEHAIAATGVDHLVLRTSWIYGRRGRNFMQTMLRLACESPEIRVVGDRLGAPTWSRTVATLTAQLLTRSIEAADRRRWWADHTGLYHATAGGATSWHGFASAIFSLAAPSPLPRIIKIRADDYQAAAIRPAHSMLSTEKIRRTFGVTLPNWRDALDDCLRAPIH